MGHSHSDMVWRDEAVEKVLHRRSMVLSDHNTQTIPLDEISGMTLAETIIAEKDIPEYDYATMDGFAFDATNEYPLSTVDSEIFPEDSPPSIESGEAVRIATGAPLPDGANAVLKREEATVEEGELWGKPIEPGTYTYKRGSNLSAGETLFKKGEQLSPKDSILLGDLGRETVSAHEPFSAAILATGTEIHEGQTPDLDSEMLAGLIQSWGHVPTYEGTVPDEYDLVESAISRLADEHDVVVTTGGTSVGHKDYVIRALENLGDVEFHRVRIRPGKPIALANLPQHDAIAFAVPGKPIGAHTISAFIMRPFFTGESPIPTVEATLEQSIDIGPEGFEYMIPVTLEKGPEDYEVIPLGHVDSPLSVYDEKFNPSVLSSSTRASRANGLIVTQTALESGETVSVIPYSTLE